MTKSEIKSLNEESLNTIRLLLSSDAKPNALGKALMNAMLDHFCGEQEIADALCLDVKIGGKVTHPSRHIKADFNRWLNSLVGSEENTRRVD